MSFRTRRVLFTSPLYVLLNFFIIRSLFALFGGINDLYVILLVLVLWLMQIVPMLREEKKSTCVGRFFSTVYGVWEWFLVMFILYLVVIFALSMFISIPREVLLSILFVIVVIGVYSYYNAHHLVVKEKTLVIDKLDKEYNIVHLSDVHFGSIRHKQIIRDVAKKLDELSDSCDLAVISGDLADGSCVVEEDSFIELKDVDMPIIFTSGNHDYYPGLDNVHKACKKAGIIILENSGMQIDNLNIYGLSYSFSDIEMPSMDEIREFIRDDMINIVNYHPPNGFSQLSQLGFDIQLSGHSHGGQFYPIIFIANQMYEGHNMGLFKDELNHYIHVTTGVGSMDIPMRWGTNSEIVVLKLRKSE